LLERGWAAETPAAIVLNASHADGLVWSGTLANLGNASGVDETSTAAGVLVVGEVVALAESIAQAVTPVQSPARSAAGV
jgi:siroheme synthase